jgi:glycerol kinase
MDYYLGVDLGSTHIKAMIVSEDGVILSYCSKPNPVKRIDKRVRQDLFHLLHLAQDTIDQCICNSGLIENKIACIALSSQRGSFAFFDDTGYSPLFSWEDTTKPKDLNLSSKGKIATLDTLFIQHLTKEKKFITDPTHASYAKFETTAAEKAEVVPSDSDFGTFRGIPIKASVADQAASLYALDHPTILSLGTGAFLLNECEQTPSKEGSDRLYSGVKTGSGKVFYTELELTTLAPILQNLVHHFSPQRCYTDLESLAAGAFHSKGLFYHPELMEFKGFGSSIGICEWTRSLIEGFTFSIKDMIDQMQKKQHALFAVLPITGGVSRSNYMMQLLSDLSGISLIRPRCIDTDILGSIKLASSNPLTKLLDGETTFQPQTNYILQDSYALWKRTFYETS